MDRRRGTKHVSRDVLVASPPPTAPAGGPKGPLFEPVECGCQIAEPIMDDREVKGGHVLLPRQRVQILQDVLRFQPVTAE